MTSTPTPPRRVLIIVENLPVPFDRRVWQEALTLRDAGYAVSVICPKGKGQNAAREELEGIGIFRYPAPLEADSAIGYLLEYSNALFWQAWLAWKLWFRTGFDALHACNPPDLLFLVAAPFKWLLGVRFVFDHHDLAPELYEAKFGRRGMMYQGLLLLERATFGIADAVIASNDSYKRIALERGGVAEAAVCVVRSLPQARAGIPRQPNPAWKQGRPYLVAYVGVMGKQDGLDGLLRIARHVIFDHGRRDVQFVLVGAGTEFDKLLALSESMEIADRITFTGWVSDRDKVREILASADLCVSPDPATAFNQASTMNKVLEYMESGKAIVQYDLTEGRLMAGSAAAYARPDDEGDFAAKVVELLDAPEQREAMGKCGRERLLTELTWEKESRALVDAYARIFAR